MSNSEGSVTVHLTFNPFVSSFGLKKKHPLVAYIKISITIHAAVVVRNIDNIKYIYKHALTCT